MKSVGGRITECVRPYLPMKITEQRPWSHVQKEVDSMPYLLVWGATRESVRSEIALVRTPVFVARAEELFGDD